MKLPPKIYNAENDNGDLKESINRFKTASPKSNKSVKSNKFVPVHVLERCGGDQALYRFENSFGASVVNSGMCFGELELAVIEWTSNEDYLVRIDTSVGNGVFGNLDEEDLDDLLAEIEKLPQKIKNEVDFNG